MFGEEAGDVAVVEVDAGDGEDGRVVERVGAEHAGVVADVGSDPVAGDVQGVGDDGLFQGLEGNVGGAEAGVGEGEVGRDNDSLSSAAAVVVGEGE